MIYHVDTGEEVETGKLSELGGLFLQTLFGYLVGLVGAVMTWRSSILTMASAQSGLGTVVASSYRPTLDCFEGILSMVSSAYASE